MQHLRGAGSKKGAVKTNDSVAMKSKHHSQGAAVLLRTVGMVSSSKNVMVLTASPRELRYRKIGPRYRFFGSGCCRFSSSSFCMSFKDLMFSISVLAASATRSACSKKTSGRFFAPGGLRPSREVMLNYQFACQVITTRMLYLLLCLNLAHRL